MSRQTDAAPKGRTTVAPRVVTPVADDAFGQRGGRVKDPSGTVWWVTSHVEDLSEDEMGKRSQDPGYAEAGRVAQEALDAELSGRSHGHSSAPVRTTG